VDSATAPPPPEPPDEKRGHLGWTGVVLGRWGFLVIGLALGFAFGAAAGSSPSREDLQTAGAASPPVVQTTTPVPTTPPPDPLPSPDPNAEFSSSCDYVLGDFTDFTATGFRFIAGADVVNTGNIGVEVKVTASWKQLGTNPITMVKTVRVPIDGTRSVQFTKRVGQNNIDLIQAVGFDTDNCSVDAKIVSTFGLAEG
jgi:hypothetical protein